MSGSSSYLRNMWPAVAVAAVIGGRCLRGVAEPDERRSWQIAVAVCRSS